MKKNNGFTLVELLITVVIVGILTSIALPSYRGHVIKVNRADAKNKLFEIMQRQEKYMSENHTYVTALNNIGYSGATVNSDNGYYTITATAGANGITDSVILTAVPQGKQTQDTECGSMIFNSNGQKTTSTNKTTCWQ